MKLCIIVFFVASHHCFKCHSVIFVVTTFWLFFNNAVLNNKETEEIRNNLFIKCIILQSRSHITSKLVEKTCCIMSLFLCMLMFTPYNPVCINVYVHSI